MTANDDMRRALETAVQERAEELLGHEMDAHQLTVCMERSVELKGRGFDAETLWRALEIATGGTS